MPITERTPLFERDGDAYVPADLARSPWSTESLHGGASSALLVGCVEQHMAGTSTRIVRVTADIVRPVPVRPLTVEVRTIRPGRRVTVVQAVLSAADETCLRMTALLLRDAEIALPAGVPLPADDPPRPGPDDSAPSVVEWPFVAFHTHACEVRYARGSWEELGPAVAWIRLQYPVEAGQAPSPVQRMVAAADSGNGISAVVPYENWLFVNPDLTVTVHRPAEGEWICLDATTHLSGRGSGAAVATVYDVRGRIGESVQSLLVEPR
jgi:hypothetical protein